MKRKHLLSTTFLMRFCAVLILLDSFLLLSSCDGRYAPIKSVEPFYSKYQVFSDKTLEGDWVYVGQQGVVIRILPVSFSNGLNPAVTNGYIVQKMLVETEQSSLVDFVNGEMVVTEKGYSISSSDGTSATESSYADTSAAFLFRMKDGQTYLDLTSLQNEGPFAMLKGFFNISIHCLAKVDIRRDTIYLQLLSGTSFTEKGRKAFAKVKWAKHEGYLSNARSFADSLICSPTSLLQSVISNNRKELFRDADQLMFVRIKERKRATRPF